MTTTDTPVSQCAAITFARTDKFVTGEDAAATPVSVAAGDINGDGNPDIVTADSSTAINDDISAFFGDGQGAFSDASNMIADQSPMSITAGDVNDDGVADVISGQDFPANLEVRLGPITPNLSFPFTTVSGPGLPATALTTGDFNHDGKIDVAAVTAGLGVSHVSIYAGNGAGGFAAPMSYPAGSGALSLTAADVNGDGKTDVITSNYFSDDISVLLQTDSGFADAITVPLPQNRNGAVHATSVTAGDFNGDGHVDVVVSSENDSSASGVVTSLVTSFIGDGTGAFAEVQQLGVGAHPSSIVAGDFNHDGRLDVGVANRGSNNVSLLLGTGTGQFEGGPSFSVGTGPTSLAVSDVNKDGLPDLVSANPDGDSVTVLLNTSRTSDTPPVASAKFYDVLGGTALSVAEPGVLEGDTDADCDTLTAHLVSGASHGFLTMGADGSFNYAAIGGYIGPDSFTYAADDGFTQTQATVTLNVTTIAANDDSVTVTEGSGAHTLDVLANDTNSTGESLSVAGVTQPSFGSVILMPDGTVSYTPTPNFVGSDSFKYLAKDADGHTATGTVKITVNPAQGCATVSFGAPTAIDNPGASRPAQPLIADFNGDGKSDIAIENDFNVLVRYGDGHGGFTGSDNLVPGFEGVSPAEVGDLNEDGRPDILVPNGAGPNVVTYTPNSGGGFVGDLITYEDTTVRNVPVGDLNGDNHLDFVVTDIGEFEPLLGNGSGQASEMNPHFQLVPASDRIVLADFNHDGHLDIAGIASGVHAAWVYFGDGTGRFPTNASFPIGSGAVAITTGDYNGDGHPDLAVANGGSNDVSVLMGDGTGGFAPALSIPLGTDSAPTSLISSDLNGDGRSDLVLGYTALGKVAVMLSRGIAGFGAPQMVYTLGAPGRAIVAAGDLDGNLSPDLLVTSNTSPQAEVLANQCDNMPADVTPPVTTLTSSGFTGTGGWFSSAVRFGFRRDDPASGVAATRCVVDPTTVPTSFDDLPATPCSLPLTVSSKGRHAVYAASIDNAGNKETLKTLSVRIDLTPPTLHPTVPTLALRQHGASAAPHAADAGSGVASASCDPLDTKTVGDHTVTCTATDVAGNTSTATVHYLVGYKVHLESPAPGSTWNRGSPIPVTVELTGDLPAPITNATAAALARGCQVTVTSSVNPVGPHCMKYDKTTQRFGYSLPLPVTGVGGSATLTVTITYPGTTATTTSSIPITIRKAPAPAAFLS